MTFYYTIKATTALTEIFALILFRPNSNYLFSNQFFRYYPLCLHGIHVWMCSFFNDFKYMRRGGALVVLTRNYRNVSLVDLFDVTVCTKIKKSLLLFSIIYFLVFELSSSGLISSAKCIPVRLGVFQIQENTSLTAPIKTV